MSPIKIKKSVPKDLKKRSIRLKNLNSVAQFSSTFSEVVSNYVGGCDLNDTSLQSVDCWMQSKPACNGRENLFSYEWYVQKKVDACLSLGGYINTQLPGLCLFKFRSVNIYNQEQQDYILRNYPSCRVKPRPPK
jgi:hypothetical protein